MSADELADTSLAETSLEVPQGRLQLQRYPVRGSGPGRNDSLRAWDAADDYLLHHLHETGGATGHAWVVNDGFGALTTALAISGAPVHMSSDSWLAHVGTRANLQANNVEPDSVELLTSLESPTASIDLVVVKVPKSLALLQDQLHRIRQHLLAQPRSGLRIVGAAMTRDVHTSTLELFSSVLGPTSTSLARRKARLILCEFNDAQPIQPNPHPGSYSVDGLQKPLLNHAGVFSRERLDAGTGHLLAHIRTGSDAGDILDLGCGNGVLGLMAAAQNGSARLTFADESFMAIASARHNWQALFPQRSAEFLVNDGTASVASHSADLILCNPPFHQHNARGDATAWRMFSGSRKVLRTGGHLLVVGNRHLAYHAKLRRLFGNCEVLGSDRRFVVLRSRR